MVGAVVLGSIVVGFAVVGFWLGLGLVAVGVGVRVGDGADALVLGDGAGLDTAAVHPVNASAPIQAARPSFANLRAFIDLGTGRRWSHAVRSRTVDTVGLQTLCWGARSGQ